MQDDQFVIMNQLEALGINVDDSEQLRILSREVGQGSHDLVDKIRSLFMDLERLEERLAATEALLAEAVDQSKRAKIVGIASSIVKNFAPR